MHHSLLRRAFVRLRRNVHLYLPALALALALGTAYSTTPTPQPMPEGRPIVAPHVNWNS
jgi:hypothetical protein